MKALTLIQPQQGTPPPDPKAVPLLGEYFLLAAGIILAIIILWKRPKVQR